MVLNAAPAAELDAKTIHAVEVLVVNEDEARALTGNGPAVVVVTLGERGAVLRRRGLGDVLVPPRAVPAVDTTAAGDAFVGGLAAALAAGAEIEQAVSAANAAGAAATTVVGAQASLPSREDLVRLFGTSGPLGDP